MELSHEYLTENREYKDYKDFVANCKLTKPENFNFAYDIVDRYAELAPEKRAFGLMTLMMKKSLHLQIFPVNQKELQHGLNQRE